MFRNRQSPGFFKITNSHLTELRSKSNGMWKLWISLYYFWPSQSSFPPHTILRRPSFFSASWLVITIFHSSIQVIDFRGRCPSNIFHFMDVNGMALLQVLDETLHRWIMIWQHLHFISQPRLRRVPTVGTTSETILFWLHTILPLALPAPPHLLRRHPRPRFRPRVPHEPISLPRWYLF